MTYNTLLAPLSFTNQIPVFHATLKKTKICHSKKLLMQLLVAKRKGWFENWAVFGGVKSLFILSHSLDLKYSCIGICHSNSHRGLSSLSWLPRNSFTSAMVGQHMAENSGASSSLHSQAEHWPNVLDLSVALQKLGLKSRTRFANWPNEIACLALVFVCRSQAD